MATLAYDNSKVTAALINSLTGNQVTTFVKNAPKFAAKVAAGKSASISVGKTTLQFSASKSPAVAKVLFNINGTSFDPTNSTTFTAEALIKAAAAQLSLTAGTDTPLLTTDNNILNAPIGTLQVRDVISDPSSSDADVLNASFFEDIKPTIRNIETINLDVQSPEKTLDASLVTHASGNTINFSSSANLRSLGDIRGLTRNVGLSFSTGNWSVGTITSSDPNSTVQSLFIALNATTLTVGGLGGATEATDIDILRINSVGTFANTIQPADGVDINESGEAVVVSGTQGLTLRTNNVGANGINISKSGMSGLITLELTSLFIAAGSSAPPALDLSSASIDKLRLYGDQGNAPITLVSGATIDIRRDQASGITLNTKGALDTATDRVTLSLTDDNPSVATPTDGVIDIGSGGSAPGIDLTGYNGTGIYANQFETLTIVLAAPPLTSSTATHRIGMIKGGVVNGTAVSISGPDNLVLAGFDEKVLSVNASGMTGQFTLTSVDTAKAAGHSVTGGGGVKDTLVAVVSAAGVTANLSTGTVTDRATNNSFALTGFENLTFSAANDSVIGAATAESLNGGLGNDTITGGGGADTLTGGVGSDEFVYTADTDSPAVIAGTTFSGDRITDFDSSVDKISIDKVGAIDFNLSTTVTVTALNITTGPVTFAAVASAVLAATPAVSSASTAQVYDITITTGPLAGHYVLVNDGVAAMATTDLLVQLTGSSSAAVNAGNFAFF